MASEKTPIAWVLLPVKRYAQFSGRSSRAEYWWFTLVSTAAGFAFDAIDRAIGSGFAILGLIFTVGLFVPSLSVTVRRLHDIGMSGWWMLAALAPAFFFGMQSSFNRLESEFNGGTAANSSLLSISLFVIVCLALAVCLALPGKKGSNRYGGDPYDGSGANAFA